MKRITYRSNGTFGINAQAIPFALFIFQVVTVRHIQGISEYFIDLRII
jgi:hypothetical protein